jgi:hypothetical protein
MSTSQSSVGPNNAALELTANTGLFLVRDNQVILGFWG